MVGTGPVKGFVHWQLSISIFCALVVTRFMVDFIVHRAGLKQVLGLSLLGEMKIDFFNTASAFHKLVVVVAGNWYLYVHDNIMGIDFTGGDEMT